MGTDIRVCIEHKTDRGWQFIVEMFGVIERDYYLFAWLSGETNYRLLDRKSIKTPITPIAEPRGLPTDLDSQPGFDYDRRNASWLTADEILSAVPPTVTVCGMLTLADWKLWDGKTDPLMQDLDLLYPANPLNEPNPDPTRWIAHFDDPKSFLDKTTHVYIEFPYRISDGFGYFFDWLKDRQASDGEVRLIFDYIN